MPETNSGPDRTEPRGEPARIWFTEFISTLLLGLAAVGAGWAAYQAASWDNEALFTLERAALKRREASGAETRGLVLRVMDVGLFTTYLQALGAQDKALAPFLLQRLRPPLKEAVTAWLATKPFENPDAPRNPFIMKEYRLPEDEDARRLSQEGEQILSRSRQQNRIADKYVLATVPFAVASLFAGISTKFRSLGIRTAIVAMGTLSFVGAVVALAFLPVA